MFEAAGIPHERDFPQPVGHQSMADVEVGRRPFEIEVVCRHRVAADLHVGSVVHGLRREAFRVALVQLKLKTVVAAVREHGAEVDAAEGRIQPIEPAVEQVAVEGVVVDDPAEIAADVADVIRLERHVPRDLKLDAGEPVVRVGVASERIGDAQRLLRRAERRVPSDQIADDAKAGGYAEVLVIAGDRRCLVAPAAVAIHRAVRDRNPGLACHLHRVRDRKRVVRRVESDVRDRVVEQPFVHQTVAAPDREAVRAFRIP